MYSSGTQTGLTITSQDGDNTFDFAVTYGTEPGAVSSSTSGGAGSADSASRSDHNHDLSITNDYVTLAMTAHGTQGDVLIYSGATGVPTLLNAGTAGQALITGGAGADPAWGAVAEAKVTFANTGGHSHTGSGATGTAILWSSIDKTTSSIADITTKSHTALSDIGSNTHAQVDTFISTTVPAYFNTSSGHDHDGSDSKKVTYTDLASIPSTFAPSAHAASHGSAGSDAVTIANTQITGLGTMSTQTANSVSISGGSISGITDLAVADGGTGTSTGSITGTTALTFTAGGSAQDITLISSTTGAVVLKPGSDSTTAIKLANASGTSILTVDSTNSRVGVNGTPGHALAVTGATSTSTYYCVEGQEYLRVAQTIGSGTGWGGGYNFYYNSGWKHQSTGAASGISYEGPTGIKFFTEASQTAGTAANQSAVLLNSGLFGINCTAPAKRLEVLDTSGAQLRLTYTASTVYCDCTVDSGGDLTIAPSGGDVVLSAQLTTLQKEINKTATGGLSAAECSNTIITNYGQAAEATLTLPTAAVGMRFTVVIIDGDDNLHIKAGASDKIYLDGVALDDGDKVTSDTDVGDSIEFWTFKSGASSYDWYAKTLVGTWTDGGA
jgi:hypothetical protein